MDFELNRIQMNSLERVMDSTLFAEETLESIVPDACPDILRIVETDGMVLLTRKEARSGQIELAGSFRIFVLYEPDGEQGLRHMELTIPFTCNADGREIGAECIVVASAKLRRADTRALNPRKILVCAEAVVDVIAYTMTNRELCTGCVATATEEASKGIEQLIETKNFYVTTCVEEKSFAISEDIALSVGKPAAEELLKSWITLAKGDSKIIGNKLIFKGSAYVGVVYRGEDNGIYTSVNELPFSQITEIGHAAEDADHRILFTLSGVDCKLSPNGEGKTVKVELNILAQAMLGEARSAGVLMDAYSIHQPIEVHRESCFLDSLADKGGRSQNVRELWELGESVREVLDCRSTLGKLTQSREGNKLILTVQVALKLLYLTEQGDLLSAQKEMEVPCNIELPDETTCVCHCETAGDCYATLVAGGVELRFAIDFYYQGFLKYSLGTITALTVGAENEATDERPSLVMRMLEQGEQLWDVAKAYHTTISDIVTANGLENGAVETGKLLLIPKRR